MNVTDIFNWSPTKGEPLTLYEFQTKYMAAGNEAKVYSKDGELLFIFYTYTKLPDTRGKLIIKNIEKSSYHSCIKGLTTRYKIECEKPCYIIDDNFMLEYTSLDIPSIWEAYGRYSKHIKKVIFNGPATILFWGDGTKTVVKNNGLQESDPEKGILYAIIKKLAPNKKLYNEYLRLIDKEEFDNVVDD